MNVDGKVTVVSDFHGLQGKGFDRLKKAILNEDPEVLVSLGDYDQTETVRRYREMKRELERGGAEIIQVPGNHDKAIYDDLPIQSSTLREQGKTAHQLHEELMEDQVAKGFIEDLISSKEGYISHRVRFDIDGLQTLGVHGGYAGDLSSYPSCPEEDRDLWYRLGSEEDHEDNFEAMDRKGYEIMLRGHDHDSIFTYQDPEKGINSYDPEDGSVYRLKEGRIHVINPGAARDGNFATIDTNFLQEKIPVVEYTQV